MKDCDVELIQEICGHIKNPHTLDEVMEKIRRADYSAEQMLQHLLLIVREYDRMLKNRKGCL